jgi:hypothetical protein
MFSSEDAENLGHVAKQMAVSMFATMQWVAQTATTVFQVAGSAWSTYAGKALMLLIAIAPDSIIGYVGEGWFGKLGWQWVEDSIEDLCDSDSGDSSCDDSDEDVARVGLSAAGHPPPPSLLVDSDIATMMDAIRKETSHPVACQKAMSPHAPSNASVTRMVKIISAGLVVENNDLKTIGRKVGVVRVTNKLRALMRARPQITVDNILSASRMCGWAGCVGTKFRHLDVSCCVYKQGPLGPCTVYHRSFDLQKMSLTQMCQDIPCGAGAAMCNPPWRMHKRPILFGKIEL